MRTAQQRRERLRGVTARSDGSGLLPVWWTPNRAGVWCWPNCISADAGAAAGDVSAPCLQLVGYAQTFGGLATQVDLVLAQDRHNVPRCYLRGRPGVLPNILVWDGQGLTAIVTRRQASPSMPQSPPAAGCRAGYLPAGVNCGAMRNFAGCPGVWGLIGPRMIRCGQGQVIMLGKAGGCRMACDYGRWMP